MANEPVIYDPRSGRRIKLKSYVYRLGILEFAKRFKVTESTVRKWIQGKHKPALKTLEKNDKQLFN